MSTVIEKGPSVAWLLLPLGIVAYLVWKSNLPQELGARIEESVTGTFDELVKRIADGVETAEGFHVAGSRPARNHNPGDLSQDPIGKAVGRDSGGLLIYANDADGREALEAQVRLWFHGSHIYNAGMTLLDIAHKYTGGDNPEAWAGIVAGHLGVNVDTTLNTLRG